MRTIRLRGQPVLIDAKRKELIVTINLPRGKVFSLSDRIVAYLEKNYRITVNLPGQVMYLTRKDKPFKKETVKSKFAGAEPWYRYWFIIKEEEPEPDPQATLF